MPFVLDASLAMSWCFADESTPYSRAVLGVLTDTWAEVPALWLTEIANVLAVNERKGRIGAAIADAFLETLGALDIHVEQPVPPIDGRLLLPLVRRYRLTAYDAAYLELAQRRNLPLATLDKDLMTAARQAGIALVGQS
ncbi:MAG TPA: type II toxin-antitoxin system VapC family toxin [Terracidiphilus sp.]|jgi:predicted nucleic acid-binding protein|nr:type II toxin-antitoxin system VapC family toxin [Terracidiphilus sp.]